jgi:hypothetical protein
MPTAVCAPILSRHPPPLGGTQTTAMNRIEGAETVRMKKKRLKSIEITRNQYQNLREKLVSSNNIEEKNVIYRRMINLLEVMEFLNRQNELAL